MPRVLSSSFDAQFHSTTLLLRNNCILRPLSSSLQQLFVTYRHSDLDDRIGHSPKYRELRNSMDASANALNTSDLDLSSFSNIETVQMEKGPRGLGFAVMDGSVAGQNGIFIKTVTPGGPADTVSCDVTRY